MCVKTSCLMKYNISEDAVAFYHTDWCPHCQKDEAVGSKFN
ncbi:hypothetical protein MSIBF_A2870006 [groundwater metagenome]|uniref:Uncharacterized protein n=1 Tax=groundwater metagenome TaxID=717931 RepID=A0A098EA60_9ZZZZ